MKKLLFIALLGCFNLVSAQTWEWGRSGKGMGPHGGGDEESYISTDGFGNVFILGNFTSDSVIFGGYTLIHSGAYSSTNMAFVKYDSLGNVLWAKNPVGAKAVGFGVAADSAGNVYITGEFSTPTATFGTYTLTNAGAQNIFLVKYNSSGNVLWAKSAGGTSADIPRGIALSEANGIKSVYITGLLQSASSTFGSYTVTSLGSSGNAFLAKYNASNGNVLWVKNGGGGTHTTYGLGVSADNVGNATITGEFSSSLISFGSHTLTTAGSDDIFVVRYDALGNVLWAKSAGGINGDIGWGIASDASSNTYVTGGYGSSATFGSYTVTNASYSAVFLAKYDDSGNVLWVKSPIGKAGTWYGYSAATDISGNIYITGSFSDSTIFGLDTLVYPTGSIGNIDPMFIAKYDPNGNILCVSVLAGGGDDYSGVATDIYGNAYIGGDFIPTSFLVGPDTLTRNVGENIFVAKYRCDNGNTSGITQLTSNYAQVTVYPNPNTGTFVIETNSTDKQTVQVFDLNGRLVLSQNIIGATTIDASTLNEGIYTLTIKTTDGVINKKLVILR